MTSAETGAKKVSSLPRPIDASLPGASARRRKTYGCDFGAAASSSLTRAQARSSPFAHASR